MAQRTVVGLIRCRPGRMDDVARLAVERYQARSETGSGRIDSYLFEDREDPCLVVTVSRWESREAFEALLNRLGVIGGADLYEGEPSFTV
jgi:heme-degrading monooxygenase HmoA